MLVVAGLVEPMLAEAVAETVAIHTSKSASRGSAGQILGSVDGQPLISTSRGPRPALSTCRPPTSP